MTDSISARLRRSLFKSPMTEEAADHIDAQDAKIAELEAKLRDVCSIIGQYDEESTCPSCCDVTAINEAVTALIDKEPTT